MCIIKIGYNTTYSPLSILWIEEKGTILISMHKQDESSQTLYTPKLHVYSYTCNGWPEIISLGLWVPIPQINTRILGDLDFIVCQW